MRAEAIAAALQSQDICSLKELAHQLKGSAGLYGFGRLPTRPGVVHQQATKETDLERIASAVGELVTLCQQAFARGLADGADDDRTTPPPKPSPQ